MTAPDTTSRVAPAAAATDPFMPSTSVIRVFAALGLLLLAVTSVLFVTIVLRQAYSGDGASGPLVDVAQLAMALSAIAGLSALCLPGTAMSHAARRGTVRAQYVLAVGGPMLAAVDFA
ncbi:MULTISPECIES: hypothetical protein [Streptomyces]|uniref:hypothetical protein n=1 Tax=Streptomyces TaxID=1883 RepID=UPI001E4B9A61|nr:MULTISPECIES: hypothetical protein [Streptomyces]UFQ13667.1 hypothetical protein J2N69_00805 [Streptomyces huasconensis]WCL83262.1 hypothetical protein PPN52_00795 [Streptomyces sp. JCM 35825]